MMCNLLTGQCANTCLSPQKPNDAQTAFVKKVKINKTGGILYSNRAQWRIIHFSSNTILLYYPFGVIPRP